MYENLGKKYLVFGSQKQVAVNRQFKIDDPSRGRFVLSAPSQCTRCGHGFHAGLGQSGNRFGFGKPFWLSWPKGGPLHLKPSEDSAGEVEPLSNQKPNCWRLVCWSPVTFLWPFALAQFGSLVVGGLLVPPILIRWSVASSLS